MKPSPHYFEDIHSHTRKGERVLTSVDIASESVPPICPPRQCWLSVGIHPWSTAGELDERALLFRLDMLSKEPAVAAIGEAGLDALRGGDKELQERLFIAQAEIAERAGLPLIVHCVRRYGRLLELHRQLAPKQLWIVHGFRGKAELARQLVAEGIGISFGSKYNPEAFAAVPPRLRFRESDNDY